MSVLTASDDSTARIWDAKSGKVSHQLVGHGSPVRAAVFSRDGRRVLTGSDDKTIKLWDAKDGRLIKSIEMDEKVLTVAFAPDGRQATIGMNRDRAEIWDLDGAKRIKVLMGHAGAVCSAAYAPDGRTIATGSSDRSVIVWDPKLGRELWRSLQAGSVGQVAHVPNQPYVLALDRENGCIAMLDPTPDLPRPIRSRKEKWFFLIMSMAVGLVMPTSLAAAAFISNRQRRRGRAGMRVAGSRDIRTYAAVTGAAVLMSLPLMEIGLRAVLNYSYKSSFARQKSTPPPDFERDFQFFEIARLDPDPKLGYSLRPNFGGRFLGVNVSVNAMGFRDDPVSRQKPPRTLRVLGVGDSTMFGFGVNKEETYLDVLEAEFNALLRPGWNVEFINTACPSYNTTQELQALKKGLQLEPDAVLIQFDQNDIQSILVVPKPDFFFARKLMLIRLPDIMRGVYSDPRAFFFMDQSDLLCNPAYPHAGWSSVEESYREIARLCRERNIPLFGLTMFEDTPDLANKPRRVLHERVITLWQRIGITPIEAMPRAENYLRDTHQDWLAVTNSRQDSYHPNRIGHGLIAQAVLPSMCDLLMKKTGQTPKQTSRLGSLGNIALRQITRSGMHQTEKWGSSTVNWTGLSAHFHFMPAGGKVIIPLNVAHPDVSTSHPVRVTIRIDGIPTGRHPRCWREVTTEIVKRGFTTQTIDIHDLDGNPLEMTIGVDRTFTARKDPRALGVALHGLRFSE